ncbi:unnamed protein product [Paramecium sonneborni]|uniref:Uncharacterized protein n=1 Tax=Paramecium sonneborni TaxID=65129 RepID=A0A8S1PUF4_9CILI|nr:unnamed protein product [Paramecium sonneborni]
MSEQNSQNAGTEIEHRLQQEIITNTNAQQFPHQPNFSQTTSQQTELPQGSETVKQNRQIQIMNFSNQNINQQGSLAYRDISDFNMSKDEDYNQKKPQTQEVNIIKEEEQNNYTDEEQNLLEMLPNFQSIVKPLTYDELNRKCQNLENELLSTKSNLSKIIKQNIDYQDKIKNVDELERKAIEAIDQKIQEIEVFKEKNQKYEFQIQQFQKKNFEQEQCISQLLEKINLIQIQLKEQTQQITSLKQQLQEQKTKFQQELQNNQFQYEMSLCNLLL